MIPLGVLGQILFSAGLAGKAVSRNAPKWAKEFKDARREYAQERRERFEEEARQLRGQLVDQIAREREATRLKMSRYMAPEYLANYMEDWDAEAEQKLRDFDKKMNEQQHRRFGV